MSEWQLIETFDRPHWERILLYDTDGDLGVGYLCDDGETWMIELEAGESQSEPTHWMPLPEPPK